MREFTDRSFVVSGGARGIGRAVVERIVADGGRVVVGDVLLDEAVAFAAQMDGAVSAVALDVRDPEQWDTLLQHAEASYGPVSGLVNVAGVLSEGSIADSEPQEFQRVVDVNLMGTYLGVRAVIPSMRRAGGGSIVNISSTGGLVAYANRASYVAAKWAVRGFTKAAALELGSDNIRVNSVHPGPIDAPMASSISAVLAKGLPIARRGTPGEIAAMVRFLLSDEASYCTGSEFVVDGGQVAGPLFPGVNS